MESLDHVASIEDVYRTLNELDQEEEKIQQEFKGLLDECTDWASEPGIRSLIDKMSLVESAEAKINATHTTIERSTQLADSIGGRIQGIDKIQRRVESTLLLVDGIMAMKQSVDVVKDALKSGDLETAAKHVGQFDSRRGYEDEEGGEMLGLARQELETTVRQKLDGARQAFDPNGVVRHACVFARIGLSDEGYRILKTFLVEYVKTKTERTLADFQNRPISKQDHLTLLEELFDVVSRLVESHEEMIRDAFGADDWIGLLLSMKDQCDSQLHNILVKYKEDKKLAKLVADVSAPKTSHGPRRVDTDSLVEGYALILQNCHLFESYMLGKYEATAGQAPSDAFWQNDRLVATLQDAKDMFQKLELAVLRENVVRAVAMDVEACSGDQDEDVTVSTVIDDIFFCFRKSVLRALSTHMSDVASNTVKEVRKIISKDLIEILERHASNAVAGTSLTVAMDVTNTDLLNHGWVLVLNNIQVACDYTETLVEKTREIVAESFDSAGAESTDAKTQTLLRVINDLRSTAIPQLYEQRDKVLRELLRVNKEKLKFIFQFDELEELRFDLSEADFEVNDAHDPFAVPLCNRVDRCLVTAKDGLVADAFDHLLLHLIKMLCRRMERDVRKKDFTQLGGLQLDKDIRTITNYFSELSKASVREQFARLRFIATLLTVDRVTEVQDIYGDGTDQPLKVSDIRAVLKLRGDFTAAQVDGLTLGN